MRENLMEICCTCAHACPAKEHGDDLYVCDALLESLRDYTECNAPATVLVWGHRPGCLDYYQRVQGIFDHIWKHEIEEMEAEDQNEPLMFWGYSPTAQSA